MIEDLARESTAFIIQNLRNILDILIILALAWIALRLIHRLRKRVESKVIEERLDKDSQARMKTILRAGLSTLQVIILGIAGLMILVTLGINITPVLASAGIAGLAVSLGAQTLIRDYIGGVLILFENQFNVGEDIQVGGVSGTVERIELRATYVRDVSGKLFTIPNGDMRTFANTTRGWSKALVDLNIAFDTDMDRAIRVLEGALQKVMEDESLKAKLVGRPEIQGWNNMSEWAIQVRLSAKTLPGKQSDAAAALRRYALEALETADINLALPPTTR